MCCTVIPLHLIFFRKQFLSQYLILLTSICTVAWPTPLLNFSFQRILVFRDSVTFHWFTNLYPIQEMEHKLRVAAYIGDLPKVRSLVKQGCPTNAQNKVNCTCTHCGCQTRHVATREWYIHFYISNLLCCLKWVLSLECCWYMYISSCGSLNATVHASLSIVSPLLICRTATLLFCMLHWRAILMWSHFCWRMAAV